MNEELTPEQVDVEFAVLASQFDTVDPVRAPAPLPHAWRWGRPIAFVLLAAATAVAVAVAAPQFDVVASWIERPPKVWTQRRQDIFNNVVVLSILAATTGIAALVVFGKTIRYWWTVRGGIWHSLPPGDPRAANIAWAMATRVHRALVAEHQYAVYDDGASESKYTDYLTHLATTQDAATAAGKHRAAARIARERSVLEAALMHQMTRAEADLYAPHRQPVGPTSSTVNGPAVAGAAAAGSGIVAAGVVAGALMTVVGVFKFMGWAMRGPRR